jgi:hypothetical protein
MLRRVFFEMHYSDFCWTDYKYEIDKVLRDKEHRRVVFVGQSPQIASRPELLEKIQSVAERFTLSRVTVHLSMKK